jgi:hypothetical protein
MKLVKSVLLPNTFAIFSYFIFYDSLARHIRIQKNIVFNSNNVYKVRNDQKKLMGMKKKMEHSVLPTKELLILQAQDRMALALLEDENDTKDQRVTSHPNASNISKLIHSKNPIIVDLKT